MKHTTLPTLELIRDILPDVDLFHATQTGQFSRPQIIDKIRECRALLDIASGNGELERYQYRYDLVRKVVRYEVIFDTGNAKSLIGDTEALNTPLPIPSISEKSIKETKN